MSDQPKRLLFLCPSHSVRACMAASLLAARVRMPWDIWHTPVRGSQEETAWAQQVLDELGMTLLPSTQATDPGLGLSWEQAIVLHSSLTDPYPPVPGAKKQREWLIEDLPPAHASPHHQLAGYRRIRDALRTHRSRTPPPFPPPRSAPMNEPIPAFALTRARRALPGSTKAADHLKRSTLS